MKAVDEKDLVIGELYLDVPSFSMIPFAIMQYLGCPNKSHEFKFIEGVNDYIDEGDGIIRFGCHKSKYYYYEIPKARAQVIKEAHGLISSTKA